MNKNKKSTLFLFCFMTLVVVFIFYFRSLFYDIKAYDELVPFKESYLPVCFSLDEMLELISLLGIKNHFEATNTLYSNIVSLRCNPFGNVLQMLVQLIFQKNILIYRLYALCLHLINTAIVFFIINKVSLFGGVTSKNSYRLFFISLFTLLWSLHPVNIESVLILINANILLSYLFSFLVTLIYLNSISNDFKLQKVTLLKSFLLFFLFLFALFTAEFHFLLPLILMVYTLAMSIYFNSKTGLVSNFFVYFKSSLQSTLTLFIASGIFIVLFLTTNTGINVSSHSSLELVLERILWLSPQIIFHLTKLLVFPLKLSIDQSGLVTFGKTIFDPYSLFCITFLSLALIFSLISLIKANKSFPILFLIFFLFYVSLIPFSQTLAEAYNLASERYLYFPSFILIFGIAHVLFFCCRDMPQHVSTLVILLIIVGSFSTRAYIRTLDWKNSISLYSSAIKETNNPLYKAFRYKVLVPQDKLFSEFPEQSVDLPYKKRALKNVKKAIKSLKEEEKKYELNTPKIIKHYGLDPRTLLAKAGYIQAQLDFSLYKDPKRTLKIFQTYTGDLKLLDNSAINFYASLLFHNNMLDKAEEVLNYGYKRDPYSLEIFYSLCDLIQIKYRDINKIEEYSKRAFQYYPYDTSVLFLFTKVYELKGNIEKYALFSYIYGLRHHSPGDLENALKAYSLLNRKDMTSKIKKRISFLEKKLNEKK